MSKYTKEMILELAEMWDLLDGGQIHGDDIVGFALELLYGDPNHYIEDSKSFSGSKNNSVLGFKIEEPSPTIH